MKIVITKKKLITYLLCAVTCMAVSAQDYEALYWSADEQHSKLQGYMETPVGHYTGTPQMSIPLYHLKYKDIEVPINLSYSPSSVKVPARAGWVGLGWNLSAIGSITRKANSTRDEYKLYDYRGGDGILPNVGLTEPLSYLEAYDFYDLKAINDREEFDSKIEEVNDEYSADSHMYAQNNIDIQYWPGVVDLVDLAPDEFHFNFLNYSGKFMLDEHGQWVVFSESDIEVEHFLTDIDIWNLPREMGLAYTGGTGLGLYRDRQQIFEKFIITTPDGFKFEFGGANATDYSLAGGMLTLVPPHADTWYLAKISSPLGTEVNFSYEAGDKTIHITEDFRSGYGVDMKNPYTYRSIDALTYTLRLNMPHIDLNYPVSFGFPVYLKEISWPSGKVSFSSSRTNDLPYILPGMDTFIPYRDILSKYYGNNQDQIPTGRSETWNKILEYSDEGEDGPNNYWRTSCYQDFYLFGYETDPPDFGNCDWRNAEFHWWKLDQFEVYENNQLVKAFDFGYTENETERLKLSSVQERGADGATVPPYRFQYDPRKLPNYLTRKVTSDGRALSEWGYNKDMWGYPLKNKQAELLKEIQYPTGGKTAYFYESHTMGKYISPIDRLDHDADELSVKVGGNRIKKIITSDGTSITGIKEYLYVNDYTLGTNEATLSSSGILGLFPIIFNYDNERGFTNPEYDQNAMGSHVGYSEVIELDVDEEGNANGYTRYEFSNFDEDIWGETHYDKHAINATLYTFLTSSGDSDMFGPASSYAVERGKLLRKSIYDVNNDLKYKEEYHYERSDDDYLRSRISYSETFSYPAPIRAQALIDYPAYDYRKVAMIKTVMEGGNSLVTTTNYDYGSSNHKNITEIAQVTPEGKEYITKMKYPKDFGTHSGSVNGEFQVLNEFHINNFPVETSAFLKKEGVDQLISSSLVTYQELISGNASIPVLHKTYELSNNELLSDFVPADISGGVLSFDDRYEELKHFQEYDEAFGNLLQTYDHRSGLYTSYIWSYNGEYPIARVENARYSEVIDILTKEALDDLNTSALSATTIINRLYPLVTSLPEAFVSIYTFEPRVGLNSKTDVNRITTWMEYDEFKRLHTIYDHGKRVMKQYEYNYGH